MRMNFKNTFGSQDSRLDLQRVDLWKVTLQLPQALGLSWAENVEFALQNFPFPDRAREMTAVKYMQQTNHLLGADVATTPVEIQVRYAFAQRTAEALEKWFQLCANQRTGGVGLTSQVKAKGYMRWLVPNMQKQIQDIRGVAVPGENTLNEGLTYELEGCVIRGLKFTDADMTQSGPVNMVFSLQIDRYYPVNLDQMVINT
jgi:hypothetical protein